MERDFNRDDFESMLKRKADEYSMYPAESVWENIEKKLHPRSGAFALKSSAITLMLLCFISVIPSSYQQRFSPVEPWKVAAMQAESEFDVSPNTVAAIRPSKKISTPSITNASITPDASARIVDVVPLINTEKQAFDIDADEMLLSQEVAPAERNNTNDAIVSFSNTLKGEEVAMPDFSNITSKGTTLNYNEEKVQVATENNLIQNLTDAERNYEVKVPIITRTANKELEYHFTPSISYRALQTPTSFTFGNLLPQDPDNAVKHNPALGVEFGIRILSPISEKVKFISGIQLNYTSYDVLAYSSFPQMTTVRMSGFNNIQRISNLRTNGGAIEKDLLNKTLQVSIPLGLQFRLYGNKNLAWNLSTTLQPSYMLDATGYLVTSDFNNYIKAPEFLRRFNVNAGLETFVSFKRGKMIWQAGPSLRYQMLSNSVSAYPVREYLVQYGFKLGLIRRF